jgi:RNA polymerase sigma-70 factor (ECF subfamily)
VLDELTDTDSDAQRLDVATLIAEHQLGVWRYLRAIGCDASLADDLTQETFVAVLRRPFQHFSHPSTAAYLRRVAYHLLVSYRKREDRLAVTDDMDVLDQQWTRWAGADASGSETIDALSDCMTRLTERARLSLRMRFAQSASREQIAQALGITQHGVKNLMQRAKMQLKQCLDEKRAPR